MEIPYNRSLHRFAVVLACWTFLLIIAGALVTSNDAGLSVPDWPTSFGSWYKIPKLVGGVKFEHTHRMIAQVAGVLTIILAVWTWRSEKRRWLRILGFAALGTVIAQGILGGITVLLLPASSRFVGSRRSGSDIFLHCCRDGDVHRPQMGGRTATGRSSTSAGPACSH